MNRERRAKGLPTINAKRVLRIMQHHCLTLERHTAHRPGRSHDGVFIALRSNVRWCSDHLEIHARNSAVVRVLFVMDACDREIIARWAVAQAGISGEMVRALMVAAVASRLGTTKVPHAVEWLSDDGSACIARDTADTARALGLVLPFTPRSQPRVERNVRSLRQKAETRLGSRDFLIRRRHRPRLAPPLDRGLLRGPLALRIEVSLASRVHQEE